MDSSLQSRDLKQAVELLEKAGVIYRVKQTGGGGLPLEANAKENHFEVTFLDIGLMQNIRGLSSEMLISADENFIKINDGAIAEQFTAQELLAYRDHYQAPSLYYWAREARNSNAEIDYLIPCFSHVLPIEVKAGKAGTFKSMHLFFDIFRSSPGDRISQIYFNDTLPIISLPFYAISKLCFLLQRFV